MPRAGELRTRTERLHTFADRGEVEETLHRMAACETPLVRELPRRRGQQQRPHPCLLGGHRVPELDQQAGRRAVGTRRRNVQRLADAGEMHQGSATIFPSITPAATTSIITGCYPAESSPRQRGQKKKWPKLTSNHFL